MARFPARTLSLLLFFSLCFAGLLTAAAESDRPVTLRFSPNAIEFEHQGAGGGTVLNVSGPGDIHFRTPFGPGQTPMVSLFDESGHPLPDGQYAWEIDVRPALTRAAERALAESRAASDGGGDLGMTSPNSLRTATSSGYFRVMGGQFVDSGLAEERVAKSGGEQGSVPAPSTDSRPLVTRDQVILDDLIVDGSICVGQDCVNGESFGFDTLRLKENNLRIKAQDTSNSASFPTNDWQITFNDSSNGGANKFSIDDIDGGRTPFTIEASAPSHSLYVDDGGRIGLGTSTPVAEIHSKDGNTPTLRLEQDGSSGFTAQTWDLAGNEANLFIRDASNGSTLPFRIRPGAPTSAIDIAASGKIGFGTSSPTGNLTVQSSGKIDIDLTTTQAGGNNWRIRNNGTNGQLNFIDNSGSKTPFRIFSEAAADLVLVGGTGPGAGDADQVTINGNLVVNGTITPDFVFESDYALLPIEEQAAYMWKNKHLPAVGGAVVENGQHKIDVGRRSEGMLEELEKAHIYIEQLHSMITELSDRLEKLEATSSIE